MKHLLLFSFCSSILFVTCSANSQGVGVKENLSSLIARCAPTVHPETMTAVISAESRGNPLAIADAGPVALPWSQRKHLVRSHYPKTLDSAVATATELIRKGHTVSLGLSQINDRNLSRYGVSIRDVFDPCVNVSIGGSILTDFYARAVLKFGRNAAALQAALSAYNSGDWVRGARDGYVELVYKQVGKPLLIKDNSVHPAFRKPSSLTNSVAPTTSTQPPNSREFAMSSSAFITSE